MSPQRIQQRRTKGWRKPEGAVSVARPGKWGNPFQVKPVDRHGMHPYGYRVHPEPSVAASGHIYRTKAEASARAVELYRRDLATSALGNEVYDRLRAELAGRDLMCWCPEGSPCHADVLLDLANPTTRSPEGAPE